MTDVGPETAFRLDQRKHFRKSTHLLRSEVSWCDLHLRWSTCTSELIDEHAQRHGFVPKGIISWVRVQAGLYFGHAGCRSIAKCCQRSCWNFTGGFRSWLDCPPRSPGDLLITMVKETVILYQKVFRKMKKSRISHWSERDENAKWLRDCLWLCQACKRGFTCRPM